MRKNTAGRGIVVGIVYRYKWKSGISAAVTFVQVCLCLQERWQSISSRLVRDSAVSLRGIALDNALLHGDS